MKLFRLYRRELPEGYRDGGYANAPDEIQLQGVEFEDGTVAVRWLTEHRSHSVWSSFEEFEAVHGHPEYGTVIEWYRFGPGQGEWRADVEAGAEGEMK